MLTDYLNKKISYIVGTDEVGRGPLAGPVVACSVYAKGSYKSLNELDCELQGKGVIDSKKLSSLKRKKILKSMGIDFTAIVFGDNYSLDIGKNEIFFSVMEISNDIIDEINILQASLLAMEKSLDNLSIEINEEKHGLWLVDGNKLPKIPLKNLAGKALVKGDLKISFIGLASIIAKEYRDFLMEEISCNFPQYGFERHSGYPTAVHKEAIKFFGPCIHHRKSFKGVKEFLNI